MRQLFRQTLCILLALSMLTALCFAAADTFPDVKDHWAEGTLIRAVGGGFLSGFGDGTMRPDEPITQAQMLSIICRVLGVQTDAKPESIGLAGEEWYATAALGGAKLGLLQDASRINEAMTRGDALTMFCRAFSLFVEAPDRSVLDAYVEKDAPDEIVSLVQLGLVQGYNGSLDLRGSISRAEFVSVLYRALDKDSVHQEAEYEIENTDFATGLWFGYDSEKISLSAVTAPEVSIRAKALKSLQLKDKTQIERMTVAGGGAVSLALSEGSSIGTLTVTESGGAVSIASGVERVELLGNDRKLNISGTVQELIVRGENCCVSLSHGGKVENMQLLGKNCDVDLYGSVGTLLIDSRDCGFTGYGSVRETTINSIYSTPPWSSGKLTDNRDYGIQGAYAYVNAAQTLPLDTELKATANVSFPRKVEGKTVKAEWYIAGALILSEEVTLTAQQQSFTLSSTIPYSRELPEKAPVEFRLVYQSPEEEQIITAKSGDIALENHDEEYFVWWDTERVLEMVQTAYEGDYTLAWAEANDYTARDKELWINAKGYESQTEYLIWVNIRHQRCNIFQGSQGNWELIRSGIVGTGTLGGNDTPVGVWKTTYKQEGWDYGIYQCYPIVRFKGGGYAFHSRLHVPGEGYYDDSIGFPVSHGCVRMYDEDIQWIYDFVPEHTTVVVF